MRLVINVVTCLLCIPSAWAQVNLQELRLEGDDAVRVQPLATDNHSSQFYIEIDQAVRAHYHAQHSETIYVIAGTARMRLGDQTLVLKRGDFVQVPAGVIHAVEVTSVTPLRVLSVQAPEFDGTDRVWAE